MARSRVGSSRTDCGRQDAESRGGGASRNTYLEAVEFFIEASHGLTRLIKRVDSGFVSQNC